MLVQITALHPTLKKKNLTLIDRSCILPHERASSAIWDVGQLSNYRYHGAIITATECDENVTSIRTSHDRWLRHPLSGWLYMGNWHSEQHTGARADPKQLVASQQCGNPETRGLVLPDYVIATCSKFNASVKISAGSRP